jgi:hypothetical protein
MQTAAQVWADSKRRGLPTADRENIDADMIIVSQWLLLSVALATGGNLLPNPSVIDIIGILNRPRHHPTSIEPVFGGLTIEGVVGVCGGVEIGFGNTSDVADFIVDGFILPT